MKCVRFKMTRSGRKCAKFSGRKRSLSGGTCGFQGFGVPKISVKTVKKGKGKECKVTVGLPIRQHTRSCPGSEPPSGIPRRLTKTHRGVIVKYTQSRDKRLRLGIKKAPKRGKR